MATVRFALRSHSPAIRNFLPGSYERNRLSKSEALALRNFWKISKIIRPMGPWQGVVFFWVALIQTLFCMLNMSVTFFQIAPEHVCAPPIDLDWTFDQVKNISSPILKNGKTDQCHRYDLNFSEFLGLNYSDSQKKAEILTLNSTIVPCERCIYKPVDMKTTIVTEWDLVCENKWLVEHVTMAFMVGIMVGSICGGILSDRIGRKPTFIGSTIIGAILGIVHSYAPTYWFFLLTRFLIGIVLYAEGMCEITLVMELTTSKYRNIIGGLFFIPCAIGYSSLGGLAYLTRDWRKMILSISAPCLISIFYWWLIPESPRWLLVTRKIGDAEREIRAGAKRNRSELPENINFAKMSDHLVGEQVEEDSKQESILKIFQYRILVIRCLTLCFIWFVVNLVYYGLSLNVSSFAGNRFVNNAISGFVEIPGYILAALLLFWARKKALSSTLLVAGICLFAVPFIPEDQTLLNTSLAMVGKLAISISFTVMYIVTIEIYPTPIRTSGLAVSSCIGRIGSCIAPYISGIAKAGGIPATVPLTIFGVFALSAAGLSLLLPETKGKKLPEKIEDSIHFEPEEQDTYKDIVLHEEAAKWAL